LHWALFLHQHKDRPKNAQTIVGGAQFAHGARWALPYGVSALGMRMGSVQRRLAWPHSLVARTNLHRLHGVSP
jgi:hypothetical protein